MCILFAHIDPNPDENGYRLIAAANRDEYYKRPAKAAHKWTETGIIGGKDMEPGREGGMWLGINKKQQETNQKLCFSAILNITGEKISHADGRGCIVADYLSSANTFPDYVKTLEHKGLHFNGYNFIGIELNDDNAVVYHHSNTPNISTVYTGQQTLAFGNSPTYSPLTKVVKGRKKFEEIIEKKLPKEELTEKLLELLKDRASHLPDEELQKRQPVAYQGLSSIFVEIKGVDYGTRDAATNLKKANNGCNKIGFILTSFFTPHAEQYPLYQFHIKMLNGTHSIVLVDKNWNIEFLEHTMEEPIDIDNPKWTVTEIKSRL